MVRRFLIGVVSALVVTGSILAIAYLENRAASLPAEEKTGQIVEETEQIIQTTETIPAEIPSVEKTEYSFVPSYFQTDYPHIKFGNGTIATSGCSITCLAMMATYLTDQEYTPVQMAYHFGRYGKNNIERLNYGNEQMQLPYERCGNVLEVLQALQEGKVAIVMMDDESVFTSEQHFIVISGMTEDGKILVNDPMEPHYTATAYLENGFANGFEEYDLVQGFSGAWIYDKNTMPEDPFLFDASLPEEQENRYEGYMLTGEDIYTLACFVWAEGRDQPPEVKQAMVEVVLNRVVSPDYPDTVRDVIYKSELYRAVSAMSRVDEPGLEQYIAVNAAMYGPYILPEDVCFYAMWEKGKEVWGEIGDYTFAKHR